MNDFVTSQCAKLLEKNTALQAENAELRARLAENGQTDDSKLMVIPFQRDGIGGVLLGATTAEDAEGAFLVISENKDNHQRGFLLKPERTDEYPPILTLQFFEPESIDVMVDVLGRCKAILTEPQESALAERERGTEK